VNSVLKTANYYTSCLCNPPDSWQNIGHISTSYNTRKTEEKTFSKRTSTKEEATYNSQLNVLVRRPFEDSSMKPYPSSSEKIWVEMDGLKNKEQSTHLQPLVFLTFQALSYKYFVGAEAGTEVTEN